MLLAIMVTSVFAFSQTVDELGCCLRDNTSGYQIDFDPALYGGTWETFTITENGVEVFSTTDMTEPYSYIFAGAGEFVFTWTVDGVTSVCPFFACLVEDPTDPSSCCVAVGGSLETLQVKPPDGEATMVVCETELDYCEPCQNCNEVPELVYTYENGVICITDGTGSVTNDGGTTLIPLENGCATIEPFTETVDGVETLKVDYYPAPFGATCEQCVFCLDVGNPPTLPQTCEEAAASELTVCEILAADPTNPLADLDCDGGGVVNQVECEAGADPEAPTDDCMVGSAYTGGLCGYLTDYPTSPIATVDCDMGGVDNQTECDNGTNPDDNPDDDILCDDTPLTFTEKPTLNCIPQADCSMAAATIDCTFPTGAVNPVVEYSTDFRATWTPYTEGTEITCDLSDECQQFMFVIDESASAATFGYVETQKAALIAAANKYLNGACIEFGFIKHGTLDCETCCTYFSGWHSDAASFTTEVNGIQEGTEVSTCLPENCGRNVDMSSIEGCQDGSNYDIVALNQANGFFTPECKNNLIYSTDGLPEANGIGTGVDCNDMNFALSDLDNADNIVPFGLGVGNVTTACEGNSIQNFLNVMINGDVTDSSNTYIIEDPTQQQAFNDGLDAAIAEVLACPIWVRKTAENECGTEYTMTYRDAIVPCPQPCDDTSCPPSSTVELGECLEGVQIQTVTSVECVGSCITEVVETSLPCEPNACNSVCVQVLGGDQNDNTLTGYAQNGIDVVYFNNAPAPSVAWTVSATICGQDCGVIGTTVPEADNSGASQLALWNQISSFIPEAGMQVAVNLYGLFPEFFGGSLYITVPCGACGDITFTMTSANGGDITVPFISRTIDVCEVSAPTFGSLEAVTCGATDCYTLELLEVTCDAAGRAQIKMTTNAPQGNQQFILNGSTTTATVFADGDVNFLMDGTSTSATIGYPDCPSLELTFEACITTTEPFVCDCENFCVDITFPHGISLLEKIDGDTGLPVDDDIDYVTQNGKIWTFCNDLPDEGVLTPINASTSSWDVEGVLGTGAILPPIPANAADGWYIASITDPNGTLFERLYYLESLEPDVSSAITLTVAPPPPDGSLGGISGATCGDVELTLPIRVINGDNTEQIQSATAVFDGVDYPLTAPASGSQELTTLVLPPVNGVLETTIVTNNFTVNNTFIIDWYCK